MNTACDVCLTMGFSNFNLQIRRPGRWVLSGKIFFNQPTKPPPPHFQWNFFWFFFDKKQRKQVTDARNR
jgi:hypothetical protein